MSTKSGNAPSSCERFNTFSGPEGRNRLFSDLTYRRTVPVLKVGASKRAVFEDLGLISEFLAPVKTVKLGEV